MPDAEPLVQEIQFDISPALASLRDLDSAFADVAANLQTSLQDALAAALDTTVSVGEVDASPVQDAVTQAIDAGAAAPAVVSDTDASAVQDAVVQAVDAGAATPATIEGDASDVTGAIDAAVGNADAQVNVTADVSGAEDAIGTLDNQEVQIDVTAPGIEDIAGQFQDIGASAKEAGSSAGGAVDSFALLGAATAGARGDVAGLGTAAKAISPAFVGAGVAVGAFAGFIGSTVDSALKADTALQRFQTQFGGLSGQVDHINIKGFNGDIKDLALSLGSSATQMRTAAANIGQLGNSAGAAKGDVAAAAQQVLLLASRAVALNPALGDAGVVAQNLTRALVSGRDRALVPYGIALDKAAVAAQAQANATKRGASEVNAWDKLAAAAAVTTKALGDSLGVDIQKGAADAEISFRRLGAEVKATLVEVGRPLIAPSLEVFQKLVPLAQELAVVLGQLASVALPALIPVVEAVVVPLTALGKIFESIPNQMKSDAATIAIFATALEALAVVLDTVGIAFAGAFGPIGIAVIAIAALASHFGLLGKSAETVAAQVELLDSAFGKLGDVQGLISSVSDLDTTLTSLAQDALAGTGSALIQQKDAVKQLGEEFAASGASVDDVVQAIEKGPAAFDQFTRSLGKFRSGFDEGTKGATVLQQQLDFLNSSLQSTAITQLDFLSKTGAITGEQKKQALSISTNAQGIVNYVGALRIASAEAAQNSAQQEKVTLANLLQSKSWADLRTQILAGTDVDVAGFAAQVGLSAKDVQTQVDALKKSIDDFVQSGVSVLPSAADAFKSWSTGVSDAFKAVGDAASAGDGPAKVKSAMDALVAAADPQALIDKINTEITQITSFQTNLQKLFAAGFTNVAKFLVQQGPVLGGQLADALVGDQAKAQTLNNSLGLLDVVTAGDANFLRTVGAPRVFGAGQEMGTQVTAGYASTTDFSGATTLALNQTARVIQEQNPTISHEAAVAAAASDAAFADRFTPHKSAATAMDATGAAIKEGAPTAQAATAGDETSTSFGSHLTPGDQVRKAFTGIDISGLSVTLKDAASTAGLNIGIAFTGGIASGVTQTSPLIGKALTDAIAVAHARANRLIQAGSPSKLFADTIGIPIGQGIAVGIESQEDKVVAAAEGIIQAAASAAAKVPVTVGVGAQRSGTLAAGTTVAPSTVNFAVTVNITGTTTPDQANQIGVTIADSATRQLQKSGILAAVRANGSA